jgi:hypothetical protein
LFFIELDVGAEIFLSNVGIERIFVISLANHQVFDFSTARHKSFSADLLPTTNLCL